MAVSFDDILAALPEERRDRIMRRAEALAADDGELRAAIGAEDVRERALWSKAMKFVIFKDDAGEFGFRLTTADGDVLVASPPYRDRKRAAAALETFRRSLSDAQVSDASDAA